MMNIVYNQRLGERLITRLATRAHATIATAHSSPQLHSLRHRSSECGAGDTPIDDLARAINSPKIKYLAAGL